ncbi:MAG: hypothetical protein RIM72_11250 [Alphaproteobacteria bacterium]
MGRSNGNPSPSFAHSRADLPGTDALRGKVAPLTHNFETQRCEFNARQLADAGKTEAERRTEAQERTTRRESFMVKRQKPQPVLRPSPALALGSDRTAFDAEWDRERVDARHHQSREERKAAFKSLRDPQSRAARGPNHEPTNHPTLKQKEHMR